MQPNEISLVSKITFILMIALGNTDFLVSPFTCLNLPEGQKGYPYMYNGCSDRATNSNRRYQQYFNRSN